MMKITNGKVLLNGVDITKEPILKYVTADGKRRLLPSRQEKRENRIDIVDDGGSAEVYFHGELDGVYSVRQARERLQYLIDEEDYYNGNEKEYGEFEI